MDHSQFTEENQGETNDYEIELPIRVNIPKQIAALKQWATWRYQVGEDNQPLVVASEALLSLNEAYQIALDDSIGIGLWFSSSNPYLAVSISHSFNDSVIRTQSFEIVNLLNSYAEVDEIGNVTCIISAKWNENKSFGDIRIYADGWFLPITGVRYGNETDSQFRQNELIEMIERYCAESWVDKFNREKDAYESEHEAIRHFIGLAFDDPLAFENALQRDLYRFLAMAWTDIELRNLVHSRLSNRYLSAQHRADFIKAIEQYVPKRTKPEAIEQELQTKSWEDGLIYDARGAKILENYYNQSMILQHHDNWQDAFAFDDFRQRMLLRGVVIDEEGECRIAEWFGRHYKFGGNHPKILTRAIYSTSTLQRHDSLQQFITELPPWDKTSRLKEWMAIACGCKQELYTYWMSYMTVMQMVARALSPGCIARAVPVWEGPENKGKTSMIKLLGAPWSITFDMSMDSKESHMMLQGVWVAELAELNTLRRTSEMRIKSFISQTTDDFVPKYSNDRLSIPRRTVFIGTSNDDDYLTDSGENTRWYPIQVGEFDHGWMHANRLQLFAEAYSILKANPDTDWWTEPESLRKPVRESRDIRKSNNPYEEELAMWLDGDIHGDPKCIRRDKITWPQIAEEFLKMPRDRWTKLIQMQAIDAIKRLGWIKNRNTKQRFWIRPGGEYDI